MHKKSFLNLHKNKLIIFLGKQVEDAVKQTAYPQYKYPNAKFRYAKGVINMNNELGKEILQIKEEIVDMKEEILKLNNLVVDMIK